MVATPAVPGALNVTPVGNEIVALAGAGPTWQQCTVAQIAGGGSAWQGTFVLNGSTAVVVPNVNVDANSVVLISLNTLGGTQGAAPTVTAKAAGVSFTVVGTAGDTSTYNYVILG
jgi:hypothetical protein